ncbi:hypothetical protein [Pelagibacterium lacus]|uniref:Uncharacterized protein n=1 Tax=Pelagibacterium lacus TaxID=2282655 RepID=A0A369W490_9HYPH|nr:hypothetical protein [Pelagibacterium lacus]RDE09516.1 hypothetical protein DVH29_06860 [Pelagibacterium lacus]
MTNDLWRQQVESLLITLKNGGNPLANDALLELLGPDLYARFWETQLEAEDEDIARFDAVNKAGLPGPVKGYLSTRESALTALKKLRQLQKRQAAQTALKRKHIDEIVKMARKALERLSDHDRAFLWLDEIVRDEPAERLPPLLPLHLVGDPYRQPFEVRAQIAILEAALAAEAQKL